MQGSRISFWQVGVALILAFAVPFAKAEVAVFGLPELNELLKANQPKNPEELLKLLPTSLRANHLLLHHTESQDYASQKFPRILLFNEDASLLMAFSGSASNKRGSFVEVIQYISKTGEFEPTEIEFQDAGIKIRHRPQECYSCHGPKEFRPIWRAYDTWPGAFGVRHAQDTSPSLRDALAYRVFRSQVNSKGRERYRAVELQPRVSQLAERNSDFTLLLADKNVDRVAKMVLKQTQENPYLLAPVLVALTEGEDYEFERALSPALLATYKQSLDGIKAEVADRLQKEFNAKTALTKKIHHSTWPFGKRPTNFEFYYYRSVVMLRFLELNGVLGPLEAWPTTLRGRQFEFTLPYGIFYNKVASRIRKLMKDPKSLERVLNELKLHLSYDWFTEQDCADLL